MRKNSTQAGQGEVEISLIVVPPDASFRAIDWAQAVEEGPL
jgi:hypothetical protein